MSLAFLVVSCSASEFVKSTVGAVNLWVVRSMYKKCTSPGNSSKYLLMVREVLVDINYIKDAYLRSGTTFYISTFGLESWRKHELGSISQTNCTLIYCDFCVVDFKFNFKKIFEMDNILNRGVKSFVRIFHITSDTIGTLRFSK